MKTIIGITGSSGVLGKYFTKKYKNYQYDFFQGDITNKKKKLNNGLKQQSLHT